jgi:hypothetical protein
LIYNVRKKKKTKQKKDWGEGRGGCLPHHLFHCQTLPTKRIATTKGVEEEEHGKIGKDKLPSSFCF